MRIKKVHDAAEVTEKYVITKHSSPVCAEGKQSRKMAGEHLGSGHSLEKPPAPCAGAHAKSSVEIVRVILVNRGEEDRDREASK